MNDTVIQDSLKLTDNAIGKLLQTSHSINWWMWLAITELIILAFLVFKKKTKTKDTARQIFRADSLKEDIDFDNIINSSFNSVRLYDELKVLCHPDRFPTDTKLNKIAVEIFQEISKNRNNAKRLLELKEQAIEKLKIKFQKK